MAKFTLDQIKAKLALFDEHTDADSVEAETAAIIKIAGTELEDKNLYEIFLGEQNLLPEYEEILDALTIPEKKEFAYQIILNCPDDKFNNLINDIQSLTNSKNSCHAILSEAMAHVIGEEFIQNPSEVLTKTALWDTLKGVGSYLIPPEKEEEQNILEILDSVPAESRELIVKRLNKLITKHNCNAYTHIHATLQEKWAPEDESQQEELSVSPDTPRLQEAEFEETNSAEEIFEFEPESSPTYHLESVTKEITPPSSPTSELVETRSEEVIPKLEKVPSPTDDLESATQEITPSAPIRISPDSPKNRSNPLGGTCVASPNFSVVTNDLEEVTTIPQSGNSELTINASTGSTMSNARNPHSFLAAPKTDNNNDAAAESGLTKGSVTPSLSSCNPCTIL